MYLISLWMQIKQNKNEDWGGGGYFTTKSYIHGSLVHSAGSLALKLKLIIVVKSFSACLLSNWKMKKWIIVNRDLKYFGLLYSKQNKTNLSIYLSRNLSLDIMFFYTELFLLLFSEVILKSQWQMWDILQGVSSQEV